MYHIFFIHSSVEGHIGCFQFMVIMNKVDTNINVNILTIQCQGNNLVHEYDISAIHTRFKD